MLEIKRVVWKNFMSYGDHESSIDLENAGQILITGEVIDDTSNDLRKSNGSGKSTIPNVILWCLFGRTMHSPNPGDAVINYHCKSECMARVEFKNGDYVQRIRGNGKNELVFCKNGQNYEDAVLSTTKNQQEMINKTLGLDWEIFTSSAFFTQYGKSWLEMSDVSRKKALERILRVDRFTFYSAAAKEKAEKVNAKIESVNNQISRLESDIRTQESRHVRQEELGRSFEEARDKKIKKLEAQLVQERGLSESLISYDIDRITATWEKYNNAVELLQQKKVLYGEKVNSFNRIDVELKNIQDIIDKWRAMNGKICPKCQQVIENNHVASNISSEEEKLEVKTDAKLKLSDECKRLKEVINSVEVKLKEKKPAVTIQEAKTHNREITRSAKAISDLEDNIEQERLADNPYKQIIEDNSDYIEKRKLEIENLAESKIELEVLYKHYNYIYKAYNERNKIKSYVFREFIPFINKRVNHYLEILNLDVRVGLTDSLGIQSNMWGYDFQSGGERKRTDLAFMLAMFDFHEQMYGRQCNILVLDEVDGRMDDDGIEGLINIIKNELSQKVECILIISHRNQMHDVFDKEIRVLKRDGESFIQK